MAWIAKGRIRGGTIEVPIPLPFPEGASVTVHVESTNEADTPSATVKRGFCDLPFFGIWAGRDDLTDSADWVRKERDKWQHRPHRG